MPESLQARRSAAFELPLLAESRVAWLPIAQARWAAGEGDRRCTLSAEPLTRPAAWPTAKER